MCQTPTSLENLSALSATIASPLLPPSFPPLPHLPLPEVSLPPPPCPWLPRSKRTASWLVFRDAGWLLLTAAWGGVLFTERDREGLKLDADWLIFPDAGWLLLTAAWGGVLAAEGERAIKMGCKLQYCCGESLPSMLRVADTLDTAGGWLMRYCWVAGRARRKPSTTALRVLARSRALALMSIWIPEQNGQFISAWILLSCQSHSHLRTNKRYLKYKSNKYIWVNKGHQIISKKTKPGSQFQTQHSWTFNNWWDICLLQEFKNICSTSTH